MSKKKACVSLFLMCLMALCIARADMGKCVYPLPSGFGDRGPHVRLLQAELARRGYDGAFPDGVFVRLTVKAVERYQQVRGLPLTGEADEKTLLALFGQAAFTHADGKPGEAAPRMTGEISGFEHMPLPSGPGARGGHVQALQLALQSLGYPPSSSNSVFTREIAQAVAAFQRDRGLRETGRADGETLRALFLRPTKAAGLTRMPLWYGGGSDLIPWGAVFQVKDVRTGIVFTCCRMMGYSHLDAEPLTSHDTMAMLEAYGGEWSWDRRPVLLNYQGEVYAASMNGKPHGYFSNKKNAMEGHFCIHFFESRGDTSQRVDPGHLQCAFEASFAQWE